MLCTGRIDCNGRVHIDSNPAAEKWCAARLDQRIEAELRDAAAIRSSQQNRFWYGCVVPFVADQWHSEGRRMVTDAGAEMPLPRWAVHDALLLAFGGPMVSTPLGMARKSSADLTVKQFSELIETVAAYALKEYRSVLPSAEEWSGD